jgi:parallel beta-helix repeat protein
MASGNGISGSTSSGFVMAANSRAENCGATENAAHGFQGTSGCTMTNCSANNNGSGGAGTAGFRATSVDCTFDSCTATGNPVGFTASGGCILTRNRASGNTTNFSLTGTNFVGTSVTAASGVVTASAWANFEF